MQFNSLRFINVSVIFQPSADLLLSSCIQELLQQTETREIRFQNSKTCVILTRCSETSLFPPETVVYIAPLNDHMYNVHKPILDQGTGINKQFIYVRSLRSSLTFTGATIPSIYK